MAQRTHLVALALAAIPLAAPAEDYVGVLRPPRSTLASPGSWLAPTTSQLRGLTTLDGTYRLKLGYKYSRYFAVEGEIVDFGRATPDIFASPGNLASAFRSTGFGVDTI